MSATRIEKDSLGEVEVPAAALWGAQTQRARALSLGSGLRAPRALIAALARIKGALARAHHERRPDRLPAALAGAIEAACIEVARGDHDDQFPLDLLQTGSGTSTHMNANEVLANLANRSSGGTLGVYRPVHPNDHVNLGQSSNDVVPTALHLAALQEIDRDLRPALDRLAASLEKKAAEFDDVIKLGRTHLMDAVPIRLGQELGGYAAQVRKSLAHIEREARALEEVPLGGTAVGTGLNAVPGAAERACDRLAREAGRPIRRAANPFEAQGARDDLVRLSGALKAFACALLKIANDLRLLGSGPAGGLGELRLPELQPGSSMMPGKVNPVVCEIAVQAAAQVIGNDAAVAVAGQGGHFELNAMVPVLVHGILSSIGLLGAACRLLAERCVDGLRADPVRARERLEASPMAGTVLAPRLGYEKAAALVNRALREGKSVRALAVEEGLIPEAEARELFDLRRLTEPGAEGAPIPG